MATADYLKIIGLLPEIDRATASASSRCALFEEPIGLENPRVNSRLLELLLRQTCCGLYKIETP